MRTPFVALLGALLAAALAIPGTLFAASAAPIGSESGGLPNVRGLPESDAAVGAIETGARETVKKGLAALKSTGDAVSEASGKSRRPKSPRPTQAAAGAAAAGAVDIRDFAYQPKTITVSVGDTVTWTNSDQAPHDADAVDGSFDTPVLDQGESASVTFDQPGSFRYFCSVHPPEDFPEFTGTVEVAGTGDDTGSGSGGGESPGSSEAGSGSGDAAATGATDASAEALGGARSAQASGSARAAELASTGQELLPLAIVGAGLVLLGLFMRRFGTAA